MLSIIDRERDFRTVKNSKVAFGTSKLLAPIVLVAICVFFITTCRSTNNVDNYEPGNEWSLSWSDEFNQSKLDSTVWTRQYLPEPFNNEWQRYTAEPETAYVENGYLVLKATWNGTTHSKGQYRSARVISNPGGNNGMDSNVSGKTFQYGKIAARIKLPYGKGIWPAFWMLGDNIDETGGSTAWPGSGEIDILETGSMYDSDGDFGHKTLHGTIHYNEEPKGWKYMGGVKVLNKRLAENFHVFEIEWNEESIMWYLDGERFYSVNISNRDIFNEFHEPFYVLFNIAVGGHFTYSPDDSTPFPQFMHVDWIRYYNK